MNLPMPAPARQCGISRRRCRITAAEAEWPAEIDAREMGRQRSKGREEGSAAQWHRPRSARSPRASPPRWKMTAIMGLLAAIKESVKCGKLLYSPHEIPRPSKGLYPLRRRRDRLRLVPAREVHRVWRPRRRRWRAGRRRRGSKRQRPQHADRFPLPAAFQGQERHARHGQEPHRRQRHDVMLKVPVGTQIFEEDGETLLADLTSVGER